MPLSSVLPCSEASEAKPKGIQELMDNAQNGRRIVDPSPSQINKPHLQSKPLPHFPHLPFTCRSLAVHLRLTWGSLVLGRTISAHLLLTFCSLAAHLPLTGSMWTTGVSTVAEKAQKRVLVRVHLENALPHSFETAQCIVFIVNTICFEGSGSPQECNIWGHMGSRWHPCRCEPGKIMS